MFKNLIGNQDFNPGFLGLFVNPFYFARYNLYEYISIISPEIKGKVLDVGCGTKPYRHLFNVEVYHGLEYSDSASGINGKLQDYVYDGHKFPFKNASYDCIISSEVLEHIFNPDEFLAEINRCMKKGGKLLLAVPFVWDEHEQSGDFARYTSFGLAHLLKKYGFEVVRSYKTANNISIIFQLINDYIYKILIGGGGLINRIIINILCAFFNIVGVCLSFILPKNNELYLDNIVLAEKYA